MWNELVKDGSNVCIGLSREGSFSSDSLENVGVFALDELKIESLELRDVTGLDLVKISLDTGVKDANLLLSWHWDVLFLLKQLSKFLTSVEKLLGGSIKI